MNPTEPRSGEPEARHHDCRERGPLPPIIEALHMEGGYSFDEVNFILSHVNDEIDREVEDRLRAARADERRRVEGLHYAEPAPDSDPNDPHDTQWCHECERPYPCATIRALLADAPPDPQE